MKNITLSLLILQFAIVSNSWSDTNDNWECVARDKSNREWKANGNYERIAINKAFEECKKTSAYPESCKTARTECESTNNGMVTSPMFQCTAIDQNGTAWRSNLYRKPDDAILASKAYCQDRSPLPATCYVYPLFCKNITNLL